MLDSERVDHDLDGQERETQERATQRAAVGRVGMVVGQVFLTLFLPRWVRTAIPLPRI